MNELMMKLSQISEIAVTERADQRSAEVMLGIPEKLRKNASQGHCQSMVMKLEEDIDYRSRFLWPIKLIGAGAKVFAYCKNVLGLNPYVTEILCGNASEYYAIVIPIRR